MVSANYLIARHLKELCQECPAELLLFFVFFFGGGVCISDLKYSAYLAKKINKYKLVCPSYTGFSKPTHFFLIKRRRKTNVPALANRMRRHCNTLNRPLRNLWQIHFTAESFIFFLSPTCSLHSWALPNGNKHALQKLKISELMLFVFYKLSRTSICVLSILYTFFIKETELIELPCLYSRNCLEQVFVYSPYCTHFFYQRNQTDRITLRGCFHQAIWWSSHQLFPPFCHSESHNAEISTEQFQSTVDVLTVVWWYSQWLFPPFCHSEWVSHIMLKSVLSNSRVQYMFSQWSNDIPSDFSLPFVTVSESHNAEISTEQFQSTVHVLTVV